MFRSLSAKAKYGIVAKRKTRLISRRRMLLRKLSRFTREGIVWVRIPPPEKFLALNGYVV